MICLRGYPLGEEAVGLKPGAYGTVEWDPYAQEGEWLPSYLDTLPDAVPPDQPEILPSPCMGPLLGFTSFVG